MANKGLKFGVYTEMNCMPGVSTSDSVWDVMGQVERCDRLAFGVRLFLYLSVDVVP
ncbi:MAG: hypothetical protein ACSLFJ_02685 [Immundisolibacter sp.]|uniref:hypothetical protein n=1 Tax=Immundisolibacter sp. TaxID=1934948 RepID=UPI003EE14A77